MVIPRVPTSILPLYSCDEGLKSAAFLMEYLKDPTAHKAPFNVAMNTKSSIWNWFEQPGNDWRMRRFMAVILGDGARFKNSVFTNGESFWAFNENMRTQYRVIKL